MIFIFIFISAFLIHDKKNLNDGLEGEKFELMVN